MTATAVTQPSETGPANGATQRGQRRRERLRAAGMRSCTYDLDGEIAAGAEEAARHYNEKPNEYVSRLIVSDLIKLGKLTVKKESP